MPLLGAWHASWYPCMLVCCMLDCARVHALPDPLSVSHLPTEQANYKKVENVMQIVEATQTSLISELNEAKNALLEGECVCAHPPARLGG